MCLVNTNTPCASRDKSGLLTTWFQSGDSWSSTAQQGIQGSYQPGFVRCPLVCLGHVGTHTYVHVTKPWSYKALGNLTKPGVPGVTEHVRHRCICVCEETTTSQKTPKTTRGIYRSKINHCQTGHPSHIQRYVRMPLV